MNRDRIAELTRQLDALKAQMKPLEDERNDLWRAEHAAVAARIEQCERAAGDGFKPEDLCFAAADRCKCGAGYAYPRHCGPQGAWRCSAILMRLAELGTSHSPALPFMFWSVISEDQRERAGGRTTRPTEEKS